MARYQLPALFMASATTASTTVAVASAAFVAPARQGRTSLIWHQASHPRKKLPSMTLHSIISSSSDDLLVPSNKPPIRRTAAAAPDDDDDGDSSLFESLQKRQLQLQKSSQELLEQWTTGSAKTFAAFTINDQFYKQQEEQALGGGGGNQQEQNNELPFDWVRRISIGIYPKVVCGSAHGSVYVADVESKTVLGIARDVHSSRHSSGSIDALDERLRQYLYGDYDGGGVLAVAMSSSGTTNLVASSGREGGVKLFQLVTTSTASSATTATASEGTELKYVGDVPSLKRPLPGVTPTLVTCLEFDSFGRLFMGGQDGFLRMVTFGDNNEKNENMDKMEVTVISSPRQQLKQPPSPILNLDISEELDMVVTAHANGNVCVYSINGPDDDDDISNIGNTSSNDDGCLLGVWNPFSDTNNACHARSVAFISGGNNGQQRQNHNDPTWSIVVGGGNGELWMHDIHPLHIPTSSSFAMANDGDNIDASNDISTATMTTETSLFKENSMQQIKPSHQGPVLSLATRPDGILVSAGHDGMLRVSQLWPTPRALYGLGGYKVWIGTICIDSDGKRLLSDGRDDVVVVHDFSMEEDEQEM